MSLSQNRETPQNGLVPLGFPLNHPTRVPTKQNKRKDHAITHQRLRAPKYHISNNMDWNAWVPCPTSRSWDVRSPANADTACTMGTPQSIGRKIFTKAEGKSASPMPGEQNKRVWPKHNAAFLILDYSRRPSAIKGGSRFSQVVIQN